MDWTSEKRISEPEGRAEKYPGWNTESKGWKNTKEHKSHMGYEKYLEGEEKEWSNVRRENS